MTRLPRVCSLNPSCTPKCPCKPDDVQYSEAILCPLKDPLEEPVQYSVKTFILLFSLGHRTVVHTQNAKNNNNSSVPSGAFGPPPKWDLRTGTWVPSKSRDPPSSVLGEWPSILLWSVHPSYRSLVLGLLPCIVYSEILLRIGPASLRKLLQHVWPRHLARR